jgi:hypothetical protein
LGRLWVSMALWTCERRARPIPLTKGETLPEVHIQLLMAESARPRMINYIMTLRFDKSFLNQPQLGWDRAETCTSSNRTVLICTSSNLGSGIWTYV